MNVKYLKENNLYEAHKQFMRLCEWSYVPSSLEEDDDEQQQEDPNMNMGGQEDMGGGGMPQEDPMANQNGEDINQIGGNEMPMDDMGNNQMANQDGGDMSQMDMGNEMPMDDMGADPMMGDIGEDEEVIDVEELTDAQEKMNSKINTAGQNIEDVSDKIQALMQSLSSMEQMINNNNQEIARFKQEFEKRNPTQTEKLNLRSLDSYPFNVNPKDYWNGKGIDPNGNYSAYADNEEPTTKEYEITNSDVDDFDERSIEKSFDMNDDMIQDLKKIFGF